MTTRPLMHLFASVSLQALALILNFPSKPILASEQAVSLKRSLEQGAPYCGILCAYSAARVLGVDVTLDQVMHQKYINSPAGSTIDDLCQLASDVDCAASGFTGMSKADLLSSAFPIILHVRTASGGPDYSHWVLFLGVENGAARIANPPDGVELVPFAELLATWDSVGVVVTKDAPQLTSFQWQATFYRWSHLFPVIVLLGGVLFAVRHYTRQPNCKERMSSVAGALREALIVLAASGAFATIFHVVDGSGMIRNRHITQFVTNLHYPEALRELSIDDLRHLISQEPDLLIVDARLMADYATGAIDGAINVPINSRRRDITEKFSKVPYSRPIVVYCQSKSCEWDQSIAMRLIALGYENVSILEVGWLEWNDE